MGQTSASPNPPQTFSYFSQVPSSSDPFGSIGQPPLTTVSTPVGAPAFSRPPTSLPLVSGSQDGQNTFSPHIPKSQPYSAPPTSQVGTAPFQPPQQSCPPPSSTALPTGTPPQQGYNPYRHTTLSSRANPYLTPPQLQQSHPPATASPVPPVQMYQTPPGPLTQVCDSFWLPQQSKSLSSLNCVFLLLKIFLFCKKKKQPKKHPEEVLNHF